MLTARSIPYKFEPPKGWEQVRGSSALDGYWRAGDELKSSVAIVTNHADEPYDLSTFKNEDYLKMVTELRRTGHSAWGIHDWTIQSSEFKSIPTITNKGGEGKLIQLRGYYVGVAKQKVSFEEWQYFLGRNYYQLTFSQDIPTKEELKSKAASRQQIEAILKRFVPLEK